MKKGKCIVCWKRCSKEICSKKCQSIYTLWQSNGEHIGLHQFFIRTTRRA